MRMGSTREAHESTAGIHPCASSMRRATDTMGDVMLLELLHTPVTQQITLCLEAAVQLFGAYVDLECTRIDQESKQEEREETQHRRPDARPESTWNTVFSEAYWSVEERPRASQWRAHFRMSERTFLKLVKALTPSVKRRQTPDGNDIHPNKAVAVLLHRLAHNTPLVALTTLFGLDVHTIVGCTKDVCFALAGQELCDKYIREPVGKRLDRIISGFKRICGISQIAGVIERIHITLQPRPSMSDGPSDPDDERRDTSSVILQAICGPDLLFWHVSCDSPRVMEDSSAFVRSPLYSQLRQREMLGEPIQAVQGTEVRPVIVGDSKFPLSGFLIRKYNSRGRFAARQRAFDRQLSIARARIEMAFGVLKNRWKILKRAPVSVEMAPTVVVACCVLHNFMIVHGDPLPPSWRTYRMTVDESLQVGLAKRGGNRSALDALCNQWAEENRGTGRLTENAEDGAGGLGGGDRQACEDEDIEAMAENEEEGEDGGTWRNGGGGKSRE